MNFTKLTHYINLKNIIISTVLTLVLLNISGCGFNKNVIKLRKVLDLAGDNLNSDLEKHVPTGVNSTLNIQYIPGDQDALLDIYYPSDENVKNKPTVFWIHGGGWVAGDKDQVNNYMKILADKGFVVVSINYSLAPEFHHPTPVRQAIKALSFLNANAAKYKISKNKIVIAGDSGGAQIAAQTTIVITDTKYARDLGIENTIPKEQVAGVILYCGPYDFSRADDSKEAVVLGLMLRAYSGHKKYEEDKYFNLGSVINYIPKEFPKTFISTGNSDPLKIHSYSMADTLRVKGVSVDSLFWENNDNVKLGHEYQFDLDDESGKEALVRTVEFLEKL